MYLLSILKKFPVYACFSNKALWASSFGNWGQPNFFAHQETMIGTRMAVRIEEAAT